MSIMKAEDVVVTEHANKTGLNGPPLALAKVSTQRFLSCLALNG